MPKLQILGIPCNQFGAQEPGDEEEIKAFVAGETANSRGLQLSGGLKGASNFTLLAKSAINGNGTHPIFKLAKDKFPGETNCSPPSVLPSPAAARGWGLKGWGERGLGRTHRAP